MPESSLADCLAAIRRAASSSALVQRLRLISSDVTLLRFPCGEDADDLFAMFVLPVHVRHLAAVLRIRRRARMVIEMDRLPSQPVKDPPNLIRSGSFSLDRLLSHIDPGTEEESEEFVRRIYEQRHIDLSSDRNGKAGR